MSPGTDIYTPEKRSAVMACVKNCNTAPEMLVRSLLHKMGFRFRINVAKLPGSPDIVLPRHKTIIFVHGCFWHQHVGCNRSKLPQARAEWWRNKLSKNVERDAENKRKLEEAGWRVLELWTCQVKKKENAMRIILEFMAGAA